MIFFSKMCTLRTIMKKKTKKQKPVGARGRDKGWPWVAMFNYILMEKLHPEITISSANLFCHE